MTDNHTPGWFDQLVSTARINPEGYSYKVSTNRIVSLGYALSGWLYMLRWQRNTRIQAAASLASLVLALLLKISFVEMALLILTITIVWMAEFINAAVEAVVNLASPGFHPMAKVAKDVASAAVLLGVVASILIGLLIFGPPLIEILFG
ncbi:MAG: diacylglycerol kinase family protein [Chloroflexi bacterium]|nr:diacylglycerol kinase family protein [Chloroflexota bacterium]